MGAENHWGPERAWSNLKRLYEAVDHPGFGLSCHIGGWSGTPEEQNQADVQAAPWVCHTHFAWNITEGPLEQKMANLRDAGYQGYYSAEYHVIENEYAQVGIQLAKMRAVLSQWQSAA